MGSHARSGENYSRNVLSCNLHSVKYQLLNTCKKKNELKILVEPNDRIPFTNHIIEIVYALLLGLFVPIISVQVLAGLIISESSWVSR